MLDRFTKSHVYIALTKNSARNQKLQPGKHCYCQVNNKDSCSPRIDCTVNDAQYCINLLLSLLIPPRLHKSYVADYGHAESHSNLSEHKNAIMSEPDGPEFTETSVDITDLELGGAIDQVSSRVREPNHD